MGKKILITGASSGIGEACTRFLCDRGNYVIMTGRNEEALNHLHNQYPDKTQYIATDLLQIDTIPDIFSWCKKRDIKLDGMIHSAGVLYEAPVKTLNIQKAQEMMNLHYFAFIQLGKHFYKKQISNEGASIMAISSISAKLCAKGQLGYSASKSALNVAVQTMSKEFATRHIRVNAVLPSLVETPMVLQWVEKMSYNKRSFQLLTPEQVAKAVYLLMEDSSRTGELLEL